jgi:hypothetical protein
MRAAAPQAAKSGGLTCATAGMTAVATAKKGPRTTVPDGRGHWCGITKSAREHHHRQRSGCERFRHLKGEQHKLPPRTIASKSVIMMEFKFPSCAVTVERV